MRVGATFISEKSGVTLTVAETFADGTVYATQDGKTFERGVWHTDADEDTVWAEVWTAGTYAGTLGLCMFHGTVDKTSRKVCQVG